MRYAYAKMTFHMMLVSFLALILIGCGESGTPGGSSGPGVTASIALSSGAATLSADGLSSTPITAVLTDSVGAAVYPQTSVVFRTNLGTFRNGAQEYKIHTADDTGTVIVQLMASEGISGNAEVWVEANKVRQKIEVKLFDPHKVGTISLRTGSASIKADGISQVAVTATVTDAQGNPEAGAEVKFHTTLGQFYEENPIDPSILNQNTTAITDVDGEAVVMLVSGKTIGTAAILATLNGLNTTANVVFTAGEPETISLRAQPSTVRPNGTSMLFVRLTDINGNPVAGEAVVISKIVDGSGMILGAASGTTNLNGEVQATYTAGKDQGVDVMEAALATDINMKATTTIVVDPEAIVIGGITVTAGSPSLVADGLGKVKIRAVVTDIDGNPAIGKTVTFIRTAGTLSSATAITSDIGLAEVTLQASTIAGPATVMAECDGFIGEASVEFVPGPAHHLIMYAFPNIVPPNGAFKTAVIIQDQYDNRIDDQRLMLQVRRAGYAEIVDSAELTPDQAEDGVFRFDWTAATAYGEGNLEITAKVNNGVSKTVTVVVDKNAIIVGSISVIAGATAIEANGVDATTIRAKVLDSGGAPVEGITVAFKTTLGSVSASQKATDRNGIAEITLRSGTTWGTATVTVEANGFKAQVPVLFTSGQAGGVSLTAMPSTVQPGDPATIIAEITNGKGAPVAGETLYFNLYDNNTNSSLSSVQGVSDANGRVSVTYTGGIIEGTDYIRVTAASNSSITATTSVTVIVPSAAEVASIALVAAQDSILPQDKIAVTAMVYDASGVGLAGQSLVFSVDDPTLGFITASGTTGANGTFVATFEARTNTGTVNITATSGTVSSVPKAITIMSQLVGNITLTANPTAITVTKTSTITAFVTDSTASPVENGTTVNFTLTNSMYGVITEAATTNAGYAVATFTASNVAGIATISVSSGAVTQSIDIPINPAEAASIEFVSVSKNPVAIKGSGGQEFSIITFNVMDVNGNPANDIDVLFTMTSAINGGEYLEVNDPPDQYTQVVGTTAGVAKVTLHSGFKAGTVSIKATVTAGGNTISATAPIISIGGGVPTDEWLTISVEEPGWNMGGLACVGVETKITAWLADRFGNYNVLDGYTVSFQSEVGLAVDPIGVTSGGTGTATSTVRTQGGGPKNVVPETWEENLKTDLEADYGLLLSGHPRDGVCNVLVFLVGEESFADGSNGFPVDGVYNVGESFTDTIDDPWRDYDDDGLWDNGLTTTPLTTASGTNPMEDAFQDRNGNNVWDGFANPPVWDGNKNIYRQVDFLITGTPYIVFNKGSFTVPDGGFDTVSILVCDQNYNPLSAGSTYTVSVDVGKITGGTVSYEYPSSSFYGRKAGTTDLEHNLAQRGLIENVISISDDDPGDSDPPEPAQLSITVTWKSGSSGCADVVKTLAIAGTVD